MILAGAPGKGLSVLTRHRAKTAIPYGGRYRIIDFCLSNCVHSDINDITILAQYSPKSLIEHIGMGKPWDLDRKTGGVFILQPIHHGEVAKWYLGTADALYQNIDVIRNSHADAVLVLSGDQVYTMDYRNLVKYHVKHEKPVTIVIKEVRPSQRSRFGMVQCSKEGIVTAFHEKPVSSTHRHASLGIYLFDRQFLLGLLGKQRIDIVFDIIMPLLETGNVTGYPFKGYWEDIGSIVSYYRSSLRLLKHRSMLTNSEWPIFTRGAELPPAKLSRDSEVKEAIIADGCRINGTVHRSILFPGVSVERGAAVEDSIIFSFTRLGAGSRIKKSIIDKFVTVGPGARIGYASTRTPQNLPIAEDAGALRKTSGITVIGSGTKISKEIGIPRGVVIEENSVIRKVR